MYMRFLKIFVPAVMSGLFIGIGGTVYLSVENRFLGAFLFSVGLFAILSMGLNLFTGKVCYLFENPPSYCLTLLVIWLGNFAGTWLCAQAMLLTRAGAALCEKAAGLCAVKLSDNLLSIFILAIFCNLLICLAVEGYKKIPHALGKYLAIVFAIMVFILAGFEHCVANMFYFTLGRAWSAGTLLYLVVMTIGNSAGGVIIPLYIRFFGGSFSNNQ